ncbi:LUD domain-containing protein [Promicromonospora sukumoe]|uniref:L-lactate dehydrogenase complex protein LldG n=1 Tax=Promicromonospora sukumoe TaxID=88382 RepID=A0A7W3JEA0_9MICO|nr:LUD domain-containing protein [Promicromonospora sukumoe]MBA8811240.1 L-lactate dehydrogenase complex protein LldG [Promicromonospora sukumoe]
MSDARTEMLSRIRTALGGSAPEPAEVPRVYRSVGEHGAGSDAVLELLVDRLVDYKAHVHRVSAAELPALLAELLLPGAPKADPGRSAEGQVVGSSDYRSPDILPTTRRAARSVVVPSGIDRAWVAGLAGVEVFRDSREAPLSAVELDGIDAVVTAARVAVAETGTIVLDGAPDQGRRAISLVPDVHVCVVRTSQVVQTVPEAVRLLDADPGRPLTWISGPSATSDIELDRVEGVHGPRTLHVALVS